MQHLSCVSPKLYRQRNAGSVHREDSALRLKRLEISSLELEMAPEPYQVIVERSVGTEGRLMMSSFPDTVAPGNRLRLRLPLASLGKGDTLNTTDAMTSNGEVEGPHRSAGPWRGGRTISRRPRRQTAHASRPPPTIVRCPGGLRIQ
jgi:hypothetical protein